jgi:hypothetical protein
MRVHVELSHFYDRVPVPPDVKVTDADLASGRVIVGRDGGRLMKITREAFIKPKHECFVALSERDIVNKIVHAYLPPPQGTGTKIDRKEAVARILAEHVMPDQAHPKHMLGFTVEDDGPDEKLFRAEVEPLTKIASDRTGDPIVDPADFDALLAGYMSPATSDHHVAQLHAKFGVKRAS